MGIHEVAAMLKRCPNSVRTYVRAEGMPCRRVGKKLVFDKAEVVEWRRRPEIQAMFIAGDLALGLGRSRATA